MKALGPVLPLPVIYLSHVPQSIAMYLFMPSPPSPVPLHSQSVTSHSVALRRDQLVRTHHFLSHNLKLICNRDHPYLFSLYLTHAFFNSLIYPCTYLTFIGYDLSGQDRKDVTFPLQGDGVASALRGHASRLLRSVLYQY